MSGSSIPYHLRPHKAVDRRLFLDLLNRFERWSPLTDYAYVSMGAYPLEDHKLVHRVLGITRLVSFDYTQSVVDRQLFNRPIDSCRCIAKPSGEIVEHIDEILVECDASDAAGAIVWLDYTAPKEIGRQMREFQTLIDKLRPRDVVRVTINAHPRELNDQVVGGTPLTAPQKRERQFATLKGLIEEFLPSTATPDDMTEDRLPLVLSKSFAAAAHKALPASGSTIFVPLSVVRYADGQQMLSITGTIVEKAEHQQMLARLALDKWPFASTDWDTIHRLVVPDLTLRERLFLERGVMTKSADDLVAELGFTTASDISLKDFIDSYKNYYRFYPTLLAADI